MTRTFRHNRAAAARLAPDQCEVCHELAPRHVVHTYPTWSFTFDHRVCDECLPEVVRQLQRNSIEYRVGALG